MNPQQEIIEEMFQKGVLVSKDLLEKNFLEKESGNSILRQLKVEEDMIVLNSDYISIISQQTSLVDWYEIDKYKVEAEKERNDELYQNQLQNFQKATLILENTLFKSEESSLEVTLNVETSVPNQSPTSHFLINSSNLVNEETLSSSENPINHLISQPSEICDLNPPATSPTSNLMINYPLTIVVSYENKPHKYEVKDFVNIFSSRYKFLEKILRSRQELSETLTTVNRVLGKKEKEVVSLIGIIVEISITKNNNLIITLEDPTGKINFLISKNNPELLILAKELVVDEIIGISGMCGDKIIFADKIIWPDIPANVEIKKGEEDISAIFLSDIHVGSKMFLKEEFEKFLGWLSGKVGSESQREAANKVKYIFIAGDLVDGIGIYPSQEEELAIKDISQQYSEFFRLISTIPADKHIILCPGNHDMVHLAEPQPIFYKEYSPDLFNLPNVTLVTNPAIINIAKTDTFSGFDVLMYHGYSFDYYIANVEAIRNSGGYHRADLIMKFLLKRRHLAPSFKSTPYFPAHAEDPLLIKKIPDFFISGHIHYSKVANYKGVTMISGSCWQGKTSFQEKLGHEPEPARVPIVNLKTREVKVLKFM